MADAADLKSAGPLGPSGFESRLSHQIAMIGESTGVKIVAAFSICMSFEEKSSVGTATSDTGSKKLLPYYERKTGLTLFPGTLNVQLDENYTLPAKRLRLEASEYGGTVSVSLVECRVFGRKAFILRTDANDQGHGDHSRSIVEIATDIGLRAAFELRDGDQVEIELDGP